MGCGSSKHSKRCLHCRRGYSPVDIPRRHSVHHPSQHSDDSCHMVALSSSTLGSLKLRDSSFGHSRHKHLPDFADESEEKLRISGNGFGQKEVRERSDKELSNLEMQAKLMEAKVWSSMMNDKIPKIVSKTPIWTPLGEPETINTWEMMDGLEDLITPLRSPNHFRSFSFHVAPNEEEKEEALGEAIGKDRVILYFTSLRCIRKTYEESCDVRIILKGLGIRVDERDVSMDSGFRDELKELLRDKVNSGVGITLPRVFLGRKYLGGAEEIRKLNEDGKLEKILQGCERVEENKNGNGQECEACGDIRFVPCESCSGSCKVYYEDEDEDDGDGDGDGDGSDGEYCFKRCLDCNENGLIRCPLCCH